MTERERLLEKLGKVKALADRGEGGEKESAERTLAALMKRYGITEEDLEDTKATIHWIRYKTDWERRLLGQLAYMHLGTGHSFGCMGQYTGRSRKKVGIKCTAAQYIEIEADFAFYNEAMKEEMELFYSAFLQKNRLFPPPELAAEPTEAEKEEWEDMERMWKIHSMMNGMDRHTRHKALENRGKTVKAAGGRCEKITCAECGRRRFGYTYEVTGWPHRRKKEDMLT